MLECTLWTSSVHRGILSSSTRQPSFHRELLRKSPGHPELGGGWEQAEGGGAHPGAAGGTDPPAHTLRAPGLKPGRGWLPCRPSDLEETEPGTPLGILKTHICEESYRFFLRRGRGKEKRNRPSFQAGLAGREDVAEPEEGSVGTTQEKAFASHAMRPVSRGTARALSRVPSGAGGSPPSCRRAGAPGTWGSRALPSPVCSRTC